MSETPEPTTGPDELDLLKGLLVEEEKREIADLRERVEQRRLEPGQVAEALPDAILLRGAPDAWVWCWIDRPDVVVDCDLQHVIYDTIQCALDILAAND